MSQATSVNVNCESRSSQVFLLVSNPDSIVSLLRSQCTSRSSRNYSPRKSLAPCTISVASERRRNTSSSRLPNSSPPKSSSAMDLDPTPSNLNRVDLPNPWPLLTLLLKLPYLPYPGEETWLLLASRLIFPISFVGSSFAILRRVSLFAFSFFVLLHFHRICSLLSRPCLVLLIYLPIYLSIFPDLLYTARSLALSIHLFSLSTATRRKKSASSVQPRSFSAPLLRRFNCNIKPSRSSYPSPC